MWLFSHEIGPELSDENIPSHWSPYVMITLEIVMASNIKYTVYNVYNCALMYCHWMSNCNVKIYSNYSDVAVSNDIVSENGNNHYLFPTCKSATKEIENT